MERANPDSPCLGFCTTAFGDDVCGKSRRIVWCMERTSSRHRTVGMVMSPWPHPCGSGPGMYGRTSARSTVNSKRRLQRSARRGNSTLPGTRYQTQGRYQTPRLWRWLRPPFELAGGIPARSWQHRSASGPLGPWNSFLWIEQRLERNIDDLPKM